jgi:hypothetical protein
MRAPTERMAGGPKPFLTALGAGAIAVAVATSAFGQVPSTQTFTTSQSEFTAGVRNQGWWSGQPTILNDDSNANYVASRGDGASEENFFTFDLRGLRPSCAVRAATLRLTRFEGSGTGVLSYQLWDVSTPAATLNRNDGFSPTIAGDLSSGTSFGRFAVDSAGSLARDEVLSFPLNAAGVAAVSAARGGFFSIGGALSVSDNGFLFGFSGNAGTQELLVGCRSMPTTTAQCKNGGWRTFGVFKNQGDCVSYVAPGGKNPPGNKTG